jgi:hypothetical protein
MIVGAVSGLALLISGKQKNKNKNKNKNLKVTTISMLIW